MPKPTKPERTERERKAFAYWRDNPVSAVKDWFKVTPDDWQGDVLNAVFGNKDRSAIKSAHGPGKSTVMSWGGWIFLNCYENSRVVASAPTMAQLGDVLWPEYAKWHAKAPEAWQNCWSISGGHIRSIVRPRLWFAVARTSNRPANLQGFHGSHILIQIDEASGVPQPVFEVVEGALSEAGDDGKIAKLMIGGNPNFTTGELFDAFKRNRELYNRITVTGDPDLLDELKVEQGQEHRDHGRVYYSKRVKEKYVRTMAAKYGAESAIYDVRVRGVFPREDDEVVIPFEWAERARGRDIPKFDDVADGVTLVLDPARGGGNETVLGAFRRGIPIAPLKAKPKTNTNQAADMVEEEKKMYEAQGLRVERVIVDEPGVGGPVIEELRKRGIAVTPYHGGVGLKQGIDPDDEIRMFKNRRARDWWNVRRLLEIDALPLPDDDILVAQMASVKKEYTTDQKIKVESKEDLKDRLGREASPDRADVIVMGVAPWYSMHETVNTAIQSDDIIAGTPRPLFDDPDLPSVYHDPRLSL